MKFDFIQEMLADIPATIADFLETPIGEVVDIPVPTTRDTAVIACGQLAANLNNAFLKPFVGLTPIELFMRIGSKNPVFISSLLAGMETIAGGGGLTIVAPADGSVNPNYFTFACTCSGTPTTVEAIIDDDVTVSLTSKTGNAWYGQPTTPIATGKHAAIFMATYEGGDSISASTNFETTANMELVATFPKNDTTYRPEEITHVSVTLTDDAAVQNESVNVSIFGQSLNLSRESGATYNKDFAELNLNLFDWIGANLMAVSYEGADGSRNEQITFMLGGGD